MTVSFAQANLQPVMYLNGEPFFSQQEALDYLEIDPSHLVRIARRHGFRKFYTQGYVFYAQTDLENYRREHPKRIVAQVRQPKLPRQKVPAGYCDKCKKEPAWIDFEGLDGKTRYWCKGCYEGY